MRAPPRVSHDLRLLPLLRLGIRVSARQPTTPCPRLRRPGSPPTAGLSRPAPAHPLPRVIRGRFLRLPARLLPRTTFAGSGQEHSKSPQHPEAPLQHPASLLLHNHADAPVLEHERSSDPTFSIRTDAPALVTPREPATLQLPRHCPQSGRQTTCSSASRTTVSLRIFNPNQPIPSGTTTLPALAHQATWRCRAPALVLASRRLASRRSSCTRATRGRRTLTARATLMLSTSYCDLAFTRSIQQPHTYQVIQLSKSSLGRVTSSESQWAATGPA